MSIKTMFFLTPPLVNLTSPPLTWPPKPGHKTPGPTWLIWIELGLLSIEWWLDIEFGLNLDCRNSLRGKMPPNWLCTIGVQSRKIWVVLNFWLRLDCHDCTWLYPIVAQFLCFNPCTVKDNPWQSVTILIQSWIVHAQHGLSLDWMNFTITWFNHVTILVQS